MNVYDIDRAKRHDFSPRLWWFFSPFLFTPKRKGEEEKSNELAKIVIKGHAFLLYLWYLAESIFSIICISNICYLWIFMYVSILGDWCSPDRYCWERLKNSATLFCTSTPPFPFIHILIVYFLLVSFWKCKKLNYIIWEIIFRSF